MTLLLCFEPFELLILQLSIVPPTEGYGYGWYRWTLNEMPDDVIVIGPPPLVPHWSCSLCTMAPIMREHCIHSHMGRARRTDAPNTPRHSLLQVVRISG